MSATNRGAKRRAADYYPTPAYCVERLLRYVKLSGGRWLEPGAGSGAIIREVNALRSDVEWTAVEKYGRSIPALVRALDGRGCLWRSDLLTEQVPTGFHVALGNPPYLYAADFIERTLELAVRVIFLLRLNFLASRKRCEFYRRVGVPDVYVIPDRPSFTGKGSDATEYAWMEFRPEWAGRSEGQTTILYPPEGT